MCVDFVHEVISACVPPVFPPRSGHGWACVPLLPTISSMNLEKKVSLASGSLHDSSPHISCNPLYPLQLNVVKHLAKLSPVRAVLACVFGCNILSTGSESCASSSLSDTLFQAPDEERLFYEFALDQSERFPTLNRWIQMQSNLHRVSESAISSRSDNENFIPKSEGKAAMKRCREPECDTESELDDLACHLTKSVPTSQAPLVSEAQQDFDQIRQDFDKIDDVDLNSGTFLLFDWENEAPYEKAVERLMKDGKLMDALALSDRCLRNGASDQLLQLLIEQDEYNSVNVPLHGYGGHSYASITWQYCIRLKDKHLAAKLALKYLHKWELNASIDVLTMCSCHLPQNAPIRDEVLQKRKDLQRYNRILCAEDHYNNWLEVEADCKEDPEGLALRLAGKGAVSAALEVAECASLSIDLRRELQGRQLVKLLTADPLSGGGPAEASRFLSSLRDSDDALPVAIGAMKLLPDLRSKQLLVHFFLKQQVGNLLDDDVARLNSWALGLRVLALLPLPSQQRCSALHEHPRLILEVLLMMKQLQSASLILKEFPSLRDDNLIQTYAAKAIAINVCSPREHRISISSFRPKQKKKPAAPSRSNFTQSLGNLHKEARRAFSWVPRDMTKTAQKDLYRKRKTPGISPSEKVSLETMFGVPEDRVSTADGQERLPLVSVTEEWVLTGDPIKDCAVRSSHKYETSPDITLFKALLDLCSGELVSAKGALEICVPQMKNVLGSQNLPLNSSMEAMSRAYRATETYVLALTYAKGLLRKLSGNYEFSSSSDRSKVVDDISSSDAASSSNLSPYPDEPSELLANVETWLGRAELLQSLLGSGIVASLDDIADKESSAHLRDRLIQDERYGMALYTCKKCKIDSFPVWIAWGRALILLEGYTQARVKFKQALFLYKGDPSSVVLDIVNMIERWSTSGCLSVRSMYEHLAKSVPTILDDSLSADAYLNVLHIPSTFPRSEKSRRANDVSSSQPAGYSPSLEESPCSNLDSVRYGECIYYLKKHGHYADACSLFFPVNGIPTSLQSSSHGGGITASSAQRPDPLAIDYGTIDDLCDLCIGYGAMSELEDILSARSTSSVSLDGNLGQYLASALARICNYLETHRHFHYLYKFQEEAVKHLEHAKI
ncbi:hypothetical protein HPP92_006443 [Vanilla planifolia]|uniref:Zinc finger FYVE domain-containing protein 26 n=1 Tax=Vanilla planifolia TaxID=51239 RepID=A0A835VDK5_VANPL|nr:hypothetical protein HPP92_006443 [Vanilla planifolia]